MISSSMVSGESWALKDKKTFDALTPDISPKIRVEIKLKIQTALYLLGKMDFGSATYPLLWK